MARQFSRNWRAGGAKRPRLWTKRLICSIAGTLSFGFGTPPLGAADRVMVQDFEKALPAPTVWVVNIPNENATVELSRNEPHEGKECLKLHYHFVGSGQFQYLGVPNKVSIQAP